LLNCPTVLLWNGWLVQQEFLQSINISRIFVYGSHQEVSETIRIWSCGTSIPRHISLFHMEKQMCKKHLQYYSTFSKWFFC